ncbi:MAG: DUF5808 domain-containing protein [Bacteroidales bacterium]|nr:DUF5808 domain-containing protein [Bacteroidales bacterium]
MENSSDKQIMNSDSENPDGWKGIIYFNRQDSRLIVPKRFPEMGWTLNFAHPYSYLLLIALALLILLLNHFAN